MKLVDKLEGFVKENPELDKVFSIMALTTILEGADQIVSLQSKEIQEKFEELKKFIKAEGERVLIQEVKENE